MVLECELKLKRSTSMILNYSLNISDFSVWSSWKERDTCRLKRMYVITFNVGITALPLLCCSMHYN